MRRLLIFASLLLFLAAGNTAVALPQDEQNASVRLSPETIRYKVMFKWGLINKRAGTAEITLRQEKDHYATMLTGCSEPWADRIYKVRDTLIGRMAFEDLRPLYYEKRAHESGEVKHDIVNFDYSAYPPLTIGNCIRKVVKKGELIRDETRRLESDIKTVDMLNSFFYMRSLPFEKWQPGHTDITSIFSGKQKERLTIVYEGMQEIVIDGKKHQTYHIKFKFTSKNGKKSSDDMDAWISADSQRLPLKLEGRLPIGKVQCFVTEK